MNYKHKLKLRLYIAVIYAVLGIVMIAGAFAVKTDNGFISAFGFAITVIGIARIRNYFIITASDAAVEKQQIAETDERNLLIMNKARSAAFYIYVLLSAAAVIVLSFLNMCDTAKWIAYSVSLLILIYWAAYWVYRKKM